jgi:hypothetical protein
VRHFLIGTLAVMSVGLCSTEAPPPNAGPFESAELASAEEVQYPVRSATVGAVVLEEIRTEAYTSEAKPIA